MTVLTPPEFRPTPPSSPSEPDLPRTPSLAAIVFALLAGVALSSGAVAAGLLLLAAAVTVVLAPRDRGAGPARPPA